MVDKRGTVRWLYRSRSVIAPERIRASASARRAECVGFRQEINGVARAGLNAA
jgi:hypothetical protein